MNLNEYLKRGGRGSLVALAEKIDAPAPDVSRWASGRRPVPPARCAAIEAATDGQVTRKDLRFGRSWPPSFLFLRHSLPCAGVFGGFPFFFHRRFLYRLPLCTQGQAFFTPFSGYLKAVL